MRKLSTLLLFAFSFFLATGARAQLPGNQTALNAAMLKLFSEFPGFTSKADVRLQEKGSPEVLTMKVNLEMLNGKVRMDLDMANLKTKQLPPQSLASFRAAGLDKLTTIVRPDRKTSIIVYPTVKGYVEMPMSKEEAADMDRKFKVEKSKLGQEVIGGRKCDKNKVVVSSDSGAKHESLVWYAPDLKNFPLKVQMAQGTSTVVMEYQDVKLSPPDVKQFEIPPGFTKHASVENLMQNAMMKMLGGKQP
jgi:hypothetical protein